MSALAAILLGVLLLDGPDATVDRRAAARVSAEANEGMKDTRPQVDGEKGAVITSRRSDFDRESKVVMFDGDVCFEYASDYVMRADRLFVFMSGSNVLSRIVALGNVAITNDTRVGSCAMAKFWKKTSEIEMFGDGAGRLARLADDSGNDLCGTRIRFWLDTEQVDVESPEIQVDTKNGKGNVL